MEYLRNLNPYLWNEGKTFPDSSTTLENMFADGEVLLYMTYGAQMLVAISAVNELGGELSAFQIMPRLFYPMLLLVSSVIAILWNRKEK